MYSSYPGLILGFHGCDEKVGRSIIRGEQFLVRSENPYDWLGHGFYFWEFNPARARSFAEERLRGEVGGAPVETPFVIGAVIDLGYCWNLLDETGINLLRQGYDTLESSLNQAGKDLPVNKPADYPLVRKLDCAVIETVHSLNEEPGKRKFDSVRGVFIEGDSVYPGAGVNQKNHIQICVRNPNCIKGFFEPRNLDSNWPRPNVG